MEKDIKNKNCTSCTYNDKCWESGFNYCTRDNENLNSEGPDCFHCDLREKCSVLKGDLCKKVTTESKINLYMLLKEEISDRLMYVIPIYQKLTNRERIIGYYKGFEIEDNEITLITELCGETDNYYYSIPLSYMYNNDWIDELTEQKRLKEEAIEKKRLEQQEKEKLNQEKEERKLYEQLKLKYEGENKGESV